MALLKILTVWSFSSLFFFSSTYADFNKTNKEVNRSPLSIKRVSHEKLSNAEKHLVTLSVRLAEKHTAYFDQFKVSSKAKDLTITDLAIDPVITFKDKYSSGKERLGIRDTAQIKFTLPEKDHKDTQYFLTYQACTEDYCLLPKDLKFELDIPISQPPTSGLKKNSIFSDFQSKPLWLVLIVVFAFGFITAFTPCVFPMIPITMGILGFSAGSGRLRGFFIGVLYSCGLALTYALIGLVAAMTGSFIGKLFTNPYVVWGIFVFYVLTAIAMIGFINIKTPTFLEKYFAKNNNKGLWGAFLTGAVAGVIASPCVGPAVAAVVAYVAQSGDPIKGFLSLFSFGMGLGSLFIILGVFYGEVNTYLKPGKWMNYIKYFLAFLILVGAFLFIWPHLPISKHSHSEYNDSHSLWTPFSMEVYNQALADKKLIIIDFRADWCAACIELEEKTFAQPEFKEQTKDITLLVFDATSPTEKDEKMLSNFNIFGLPTVLFIDSTGKIRDDLTLTGFEEWQDFQKRLEHLKNSSP